MEIRQKQNEEKERYLFLQKEKTQIEEEYLSLKKKVCKYLQAL